MFCVDQKRNNFFVFTFSLFYVIKLSVCRWASWVEWRKRQNANKNRKNRFHILWNAELYVAESFNSFGFIYCVCMRLLMKTIAGKQTKNRFAYIRCLQSKNITHSHRNLRKTHANNQTFVIICEKSWKYWCHYRNDDEQKTNKNKIKTKNMLDRKTVTNRITNIIIKTDRELCRENSIVKCAYCSLRWEFLKDFHAPTQIKHDYWALLVPLTNNDKWWQREIAMPKYSFGICYRNAHTHNKNIHTHTYVSLYSEEILLCVIIWLCIEMQSKGASVPLQCFFILLLEAKNHVEKKITVNLVGVAHRAQST